MKDTVCVYENVKRTPMSCHAYCAAACTGWLRWINLWIYVVARGFVPCVGLVVFMRTGSKDSQSFFRYFTFVVFFKTRFSKEHALIMKSEMELVCLNQALRHESLSSETLASREQTRRVNRPTWLVSQVICTGRGTSSIYIVTMRVKIDDRLMEQQLEEQGFYSYNYRQLISKASFFLWISFTISPTARVHRMLRLDMSNDKQHTQNEKSEKGFFDPTVLLHLSMQISMHIHLVFLRSMQVLHRVYCGK